MKGQYITVAVCFVALLNSCSARSTSLSRRDNQDESLPNETPELLSEDVYEHRKQPEYNEDDLEQDDNLERRDTQGISDQTSAAIVSGFQSYNNPEQLQQLKDILSLEMNNKEKFAQVYSQMNPEQVKKIRELVLRVGQQTGSQELIKFGQCKSPRFSEKQVQTLIGLGEALYERLNTDATVQNRAGLSAGDQTAVFNQMKASIGNQQDFIRRLVNMIEVQLSKAPQIDDGEFAEIKQITAQIKSLSSQVQTQLQEATDLSQLTNMGDQLLKINSLSSRLQNKVSAELLEDKLKEYVNNVQQSTDNTQTLIRRNSIDATESKGSKNTTEATGSNNLELAKSENEIHTTGQRKFKYDLRHGRNHEHENNPNNDEETATEESEVLEKSDEHKSKVQIEAPFTETEDREQKRSGTQGENTDIIDENITEAEDEATHKDELQLEDYEKVTPDNEGHEEIAKSHTANERESAPDMNSTGNKLHGHENHPKDHNRHHERSHLESENKDTHEGHIDGAEATEEQKEIHEHNHGHRAHEHSNDHENSEHHHSTRPHDKHKDDNEQETHLQYDEESMNHQQNLASVHRKMKPVFRHGDNRRNKCSENSERPQEGQRQNRQGEINGHGESISTKKIPVASKQKPQQKISLTVEEFNSDTLRNRGRREVSSVLEKQSINSIMPQIPLPIKIPLENQFDPSDKSNKSNSTSGQINEIKEADPINSMIPQIPLPFKIPLENQLDSSDKSNKSNSPSGQMNEIKEADPIGAIIKEIFDENEDQTVPPPRESTHHKEKGKEEITIFSNYNDFYW